MSDACNWTLPPQRQDTSPPASNAVACGWPCVQEFRLPVRGATLELEYHRCEAHKLSLEFISRLRSAEHR